MNCVQLIDLNRNAVKNKNSPDVFFTSIAVVVRITGHQSSSVKVGRKNKRLSPQPANDGSDLKHITAFRSRQETRTNMKLYHV